jgi:hypothetical protein
VHQQEKDMNSKLWLGGAALTLALLAGCGGSSNNSMAASSSSSSAASASSSSAASVATTDAYTQSVQALVGSNSDTAAPADITGFVPVLSDNAAPIAVF